MQLSTSPLRTSGFGTSRSRAVLAALRYRAAPPLARLATFCYALWQLLVEQKLFLHSFLIERIGNPAVPKPPLGYGNVMALKIIMLWQQLRRDPDALKDVQRLVYGRIHRRLQTHGVATGEMRHGAWVRTRIGSTSPFTWLAPKRRPPVSAFGTSPTTSISRK